MSPVGGTAYNDVYESRRVSSVGTYTAWAGMSGVPVLNFAVKGVPMAYGLSVIKLKVPQRKRRSFHPAGLV